MADIQAIVSYPNINQIFSATYTIAHGISPGLILIQMAPQEGMPDDVGTFVITYGDVQLILPDCKLDAASFQFGEGGQTWSVSFFDRRWKWKFGKISGRYNIRDTGFNIIENSAKPLASLIVLCLQSMQELSAIPNIPSSLPLADQPTVEWDYTNPAEALSNLVEQYGHRVSLDTNGLLTIVQTGVGAELPQTPDLLNITSSPDPLETPDEIVIVGGISKYQYDFLLTPIGREINGKFERIKDLSYAPDLNDPINGGWDIDDWPFYHIVDDPANPGNKEVPDRYAKEYVGRAYQIMMAQSGNPAPGSFQNVPLDDIVQIISDAINLGVYDKSNLVDLRTSILPFDGQRLDKLIEDEVQPDGTVRTVVVNKSPMVYGIYYLDERLSDSDSGNSVDDDNFKFVQDDDTGANTLYMIYREGFSLDLQNGIVHFANPVKKIATKQSEIGNYAANSDGNEVGLAFVPAKMVLKISFGIKDTTTHQYKRWEHSRKLTPQPSKPNKGQPVTPPLKLYIKHEELVLETTYILDDQFRNIIQTNTNEDDLITQAEQILDTLVASYNNVLNPQIASYVGIKQIVLDGAIQQITWSVDETGATTTAYRNNDYHPYMMSYEERRHVEKTKQVLRDRAASLGNIPQSAQPLPPPWLIQSSLG